MGLSLVLSTQASAGSRVAAPQKPGEQSDFAMEDESLEHAIDIPASVLALLRSDPFVLSCLEPGQSPNDIIANWFIGSAIHLNNSRNVGLVVQPRKQPTAIQPCLLHAHSIPFWVFIETQDGYALALKDTVQTLRILHTKSNGYCDIETSISTLSGQTKWFYKFDGRKYELFRKTSSATQGSN